MNKRDWQADMAECQMWRTRTTSSLPSIGIHWLQQYAAEKERADQAEAREQKLKEALERILKTTKEEAASKYYTNTIILRKAIILRQKVIENLFSALYPKEETE